MDARNEIFARTDRAVLAWYWVLESHELRRGRIRAVRLLGRDLVVFRTRSGRLVALDAHCPHMGAHLAEGRVDGEGIRCFFHGWKLDDGGCVTDVPCQHKVPRVGVESWPVREAYGLIWIWPGREPARPIPFVPELADRPLRTAIGPGFVKPCHPNVVMVNAIDEQHFSTVHRLPVDLHFDVRETQDGAQTFENTTRIPTTRWWQRLMGRLYAGPLTYRMCYWGGTTGSVTVGPDFFHFHILFAFRPEDDGSAAGRTIALTPSHRGSLGWAFDRLALVLATLVGAYFARGDTRVFRTIRWHLRTPLRADRSILAFVRHVEGLPAIATGSWAPIDPADRGRVHLRVQGAS